MRRIILLAPILLWAYSAHAQRGIQDPRRLIDTAVIYLENAEYLKADEYFMSAINQIEVLSADFCFYFGKNSFYLSKFSQSIDWLNKYLELKGSKGQFSKETLALLDKAEEGYRTQNKASKNSTDVNSKFFYENTIACKEGALITCPVCKGQDVIITIDRFGLKNYKTCPYSHNGVLTCADYTLLIQGKLAPKKK